MQKVIKNGKVVGITGASGMIGTALNSALTDSGYNVMALTRNFDINNIAGCDIIINLAGANIGKRWSKTYMREIRESRLGTTSRIAQYLRDIHLNEPNTADKGKRLFISASATGIYKENTSQVFTERCFEYGDDFLAELCKSWEGEAMKASEYAKVAITRFGVVMTKKGGALPKMILPSKFGIKVIIGSGEQNISWISLEDLVRGIIFIIETGNEGVFNFTAPGSLTYKTAADTISQEYPTFIKIRVPEFALRAILKDGHKILTSGNITYPERLIESGFTFEKPLFVM